VPYEPLGHSPNVHPFAIDLFVNEGSAVRSAWRGLVVLAEGGWRPLEWFSTSSVRGGNAVIVFDAGANRFYRYAHLESIYVSAGDFVEPGDQIGAVGHTGFNAARKGHGRHLHFEINEFDARTSLVSAVGHDALEAMLEAARSVAPPLALTGAESLESWPSANPQTDQE
jgi:murein DD-endopeptidase MepM/ murein hydrolase activator NlpD